MNAYNFYGLVSTLKEIILSFFFVPNPIPKLTLPLTLTPVQQYDVEPN